MPGKSVYHFSNVNMNNLQRENLISFKMIIQENDSNITQETFLKKDPSSTETSLIYKIITGNDIFGTLTFSNTEAI